MLKKLLTTLLLGGIGIFMLIIGFTEYRETSKLKAEGKATTGEVTEFDERRGRKGRRKYYLTVAFKTESGQSVSATEKVSSGVFSDAVQTKKAPVIYLPSTPSICRFTDEVGKDYTGLGVGVFLLGCSAVTVFRRSGR